jgi:hypothetical protein
MLFGKTEALETKQCDEAFVPGLTANNFRLLRMEFEQRIESILTAS